MLNRAAKFLVAKRIWFTSITLAITAICAVLALRVGINTDMTKYLADSSNMKQGLDIMDTDFPEIEEESSIRAMFNDLTREQISAVLIQLERIPYVDSVDYQAKSESYNKENHTLFVLNTKYDYGSEEELSIERALEENYADYDMVFQNNDTQEVGVPAWLLLAAMAILMVILFTMSASWLEPLLFLLTIGIAVVINLGTNIFLGYTSTLTLSLAPILQLVLSMDYSIILINRFRQELEKEPDKETAMATALEASFSSIASSALTTVVGLIVLVFLTYKIGVELGIVLAKGVFLSKVCVFAIMPTLILRFSKGIQRTAKAVPPLKTGWLSRFSYKFRRVIPAVFVLIFAVAFILQNRTAITFTQGLEDPMADIFPKDNTTVLIYDNRDEGNIAELVEELESDPHTRSVMGYANTLAKPLSAIGMARALGELDNSARLDGSIVSMLYYNYYDGTLPELAADDFLSFISTEVLTNDSFAEYIDSGTKDNLDRLRDFSDKEKLTTPMSIAELADMFDMDEKDVKSLMLLYLSDSDKAEFGTMRMPTFVEFLLNEVAADPDYSSMFSRDQLSEMNALRTFINAGAMTAPLDYKGLASVLGMNENSAMMLMIYYQSMNALYAPGTMTLIELAGYMQTLSSDPTFAPYFDANTLARLQQLSMLSDKSLLALPLTTDLIAMGLGMDESAVKQIFALRYPADVESKTMTLPVFLDCAVNSAGATQLAPFKQLVDGAAAGDPTSVTALAATLGVTEAEVPGILAAELNYSQMAAYTGMDAAAAKQIYVLYYSADTSGKTMSMTEFVDFAVNTAGVTQLQGMQAIINAVNTDAQLDPAAAAALFGMDAGTMKLMYTYKAAQGGAISGWRISAQTAVNFIVDNSGTFSSMLSAYELSSLKMVRGVINGTVYETDYGPWNIASVFNFSGDDAEKLFLLYKSKHGDISGWKAAPQDFVGFIDDKVLTDKSLSDKLDAEQTKQVRSARELIDAVISGKKLSAEGMSALLSGLSDEVSGDQVELLYLYRAAQKLARPSWTMTIEELANYLVDDVLDDQRFSSLFDSEMREKLMDMKGDMTDAVAQLKGDKYSRLVIATDYPEESAETGAFMTRLDQLRERYLENGSYAVGTSAMVHELESSFGREYVWISILTAAAIFIVVAVTFRSLIIPLLLVLLVQCGVYITVAVIGLQGNSVYYLALLIVQSILMGATIDYAIVITNYYGESRQTMDVRDALTAAYSGTINTVLTSGSILILVTAALGFFTEQITSEVLTTISLGALSAVLLILFILPGILALFDKLIAGKARYTSE